MKKRDVDEVLGRLAVVERPEMGAGWQDGVMGRIHEESLVGGGSGVLPLFLGVRVTFGGLAAGLALALFVGGLAGVIGKPVGGGVVVGGSPMEVFAPDARGFSGVMGR
ncbi:MAG: hypothetical protein P8J87_14625 [Verrucomicrobiales bacterium]|nr:hypothetical protein [Verrucomicrobiales bacterium]